MVFSSVIFLFLFLPIFLAGYYLIRFRYRSAWILLWSWVFYGWWRLDFLLILVLASVMAWAVTGRIAALREDHPRAARRWRNLGVCLAIGVLGYFKYFNFGVDSLSSIVVAFGGQPIQALRVVLPIGISFFTFQIISYIVDVHRGTAPVARSFLDAAAYVSLFPQLVAGPIVRYSQVALQLRERVHSWDRFGAGSHRFIIGLTRKVLIADAVAVLADAAFALETPAVIPAWIGLLAYAVQIYFDFAAYSDMAIGMGLMLGFEFPENFDMPYHAASITEFWRRWHMTLSSWLRDYLYIPLGGSRGGAGRTYVNLMLVMLLGGLWHGAAWSFVIWGAWHGGWLAAERLAFGKDASRRTGFIGRIVTLGAVLVGWVLFRATTLGGAIRYLGGLFGRYGAEAQSEFVWQVPAGSIVALGIGLLIVAFEPRLRPLISGTSRRTGLAIGLSVVLLLLSILRIAASSYSPFLYFQF